MIKNFEFDTECVVACALQDDAASYINDRVQEIVATRYSFIIDESAELLYPADSLLDKYKRLAYGAGAAVTLEALEHADLDRNKLDYIKHSFLCSALPNSLKDSDPTELKDEIKFTSLLGHTSHPELDHIGNLIGRYYVDVTQDTEIRSAVFIGVGRTAFVLDKCFESLRLLDPRFDFARTIEETDFNSLNWHDLIEE